MTERTEKQEILRGIVCNGDSIIEACENANLKLLREQGDGELADLIERILKEAEEFSATVGLFDDELVDQTIEEDEDEQEEEDK